MTLTLGVLNFPRIHQSVSHLYKTANTWREEDMANLCTDAGHGGEDSGAVWAGTEEQLLNLQYVLALNTELKKRGHRVLTTRKGDNPVPSLQERCQLINAHHRNKAPEFDAIISLHCNVAAKRNPVSGVYETLESVRGFFAIYSAELSASRNLASAIAQKVNDQGIALHHNGLLSTVDLGRALAWIHRTLPTAVLLELGFMTNAQELQLLKEPAYRQKMVKAIADGIEVFLNQ